MSEKLSASSKRDVSKILSELAVVFDSMVGLASQGDFLIGEAHRLLRAPRHRARGTKPSVLVVDDDQRILRSVERTLKGKFTITRAATVTEAIELVRSVPFDAIVADYNLNEGTGVDILRVALREQPDATRVLHTAQPASLLPRQIPSHLIQHVVFKPAPEGELARVLLESIAAD